MKIVLTAGLLLFLGSAAFALPCTNGTLQSYLDLGAGGCDLGAATFSGFQIVPGQTGGTPISPNGVQITPGGSVFNPMLTFGLSSPTASPGQLLESIFRFNVSGSELLAASLQLAGTITGDGLLANVLDVCRDGSFVGAAPVNCPNGTGVAITVIANGVSELMSSTGPIPANFFDVFFDLTLDGGPGGTATLGAASVTVAAIPEPSPGLLLLTGLAAIAGIKARRNQ